MLAGGTATGTAQSLQASLNHADFGPVSLQFNAGANGFTVRMASDDPGFAASATAAIASANARANADTATPFAPGAAMSVATTAGANASGFGPDLGGSGEQSGHTPSGNPQSGTPLRHEASTTGGFAAAAGGGMAGGQGSSGQNSQSFTGAPVIQRPASITAQTGAVTTTPDTASRTPSGIYA